MLPNALQQATQLYEGGRFDDAAQLCRALLARQPDEPEIHHLLGLICYRQGDTKAALELLKRAAASARATARTHSNLGAVLKLLDKPEAAVTAYQRALAARPMASSCGRIIFP